MAKPLHIQTFVSADELIAMIARAKREDMGEIDRDISSLVFIPEDRPCVAVMHSRRAGVLAGAGLFPLIAPAFDPAITIESRKEDGDALNPRDTIATFKGPLRSVLAMERIALNFATHLSGIATLTAAFVAAVAGTKAKICDTRKTIPGLRGLEKYAVACGGGCNHRIGLFDAVLVKDNHIAHVPAGQLASALSEAISKARAMRPPPTFIEVEVDTLDQLNVVLGCDVDIILLDNMTPSQLQQAVMLRDRVAPKVELEASGGVNLSTVRAIAETGVDRISVGALTHSAPALDLGLDIE
ncbi:MAG: carboxylating nicotinate-nucleotide diphosphorylase [Phycisphaeraceae bacterium]